MHYMFTNKGRIMTDQVDEHLNLAAGMLSSTAWIRMRVSTEASLVTATSVTFIAFVKIVFLLKICNSKTITWLSKYLLFYTIYKSSFIFM